MTSIKIIYKTAAALICAAAVLLVVYQIPRSVSIPVGAGFPRPDPGPNPVSDRSAEGRGNPAPTYLPINTSHFLDLPRFFAVSHIAVPTSTISGTVVAGVVNHHVLAVDVLERFAKGMRAARPDAKRIIILSPDHFHAGRSAVSTHVRPYQTPLGRVEVDREAVAYLAQHSVVIDNGPMFEQEHGVGALIPFLHRSFADMQIVPVAIRGETDDATLVNLAHTLEPLLDRQAVIVVSADMSHYLTEDVALKNDVQTLKWLQALDAQAFDAATDDFVDNGSSFVVLSHIFEQRDQKLTFTLLDHTISSRYAGSRDNTTSYLTGVWSLTE
jgi:poly-gamma-glutamate synthesis protein (capsule biosynthesis protein)